MYKRQIVTFSAIFPCTPYKEREIAFYILTL